MATTQIYPKSMANVEFTAPIIGPKVYVTKGPSGWPETFNRELADRELTKFVEPLDLAELIDTFVLQRTIAEEDSTLTWPHVTHFLARMMSVPLKLVPPIVGVAFWAKVILALEAHGQDVN